MKKALVLLLTFGIGFVVSAQEVLFNQEDIDQGDSIVLHPQWTFEAFSSPAIGSQVPEFQTLDLDQSHISWGEVREEALASQKAIMIVYGSLSCPALRNLMANVSVSVSENRTDDLLVIHLASSIEAHASNGYSTPWWDQLNGAPSLPSQIPEINEGFDLPQPWTMGEYVDGVETLQSDLLNMFGVPWYPEATILLDSKESHFTQWFVGPAGVAIVDPLTNGIRYSESWAVCGVNGHEQCPTIYSVIDEVLLGLQAVGISEKESHFLLKKDGVAFSKKTSGYISNTLGQVVYEFSDAHELQWSNVLRQDGLHIISFNQGTQCLKVIR
jgi:hypothetical protein